MGARGSRKERGGQREKGAGVAHGGREVRRGTGRIREKGGAREVREEREEGGVRRGKRRNGDCVIAMVAAMAMTMATGRK